MSAKNIKILLLEKDSGLLGPLEAQLKEIGGVELCAKVLNPEELADQYKKSLPDIILLDIGFEEDSVYSFLASLEPQVAGGHLALIAMAGSSDMNRIRRAMKSGCVDFLMLPVTNEEISNAVKSAYEKNQSLLKSSLAVPNSLRTPAGKIVTIFST